jgi:hypothetical protein
VGALRRQFASHAAEEARPAGVAASRSTSVFVSELDSRQAAAARRDGRFPEQRAGKRAAPPDFVWPFPHNGDTRFSMAEHRGRTAGRPS